MKLLLAPTVFITAMVFSFSFKKAVSALWMPIPARRSVKMLIRLRKKKRLSKKRLMRERAVRYVSTRS